MLSFNDACLEREWASHGSLPRLAALDRLALTANLALNAAFLWRAAAHAGDDLPWLAALFAKDLVVSGGFIAVITRAHVYAPFRVPLVLLIRVFRIFAGPPRLYPQGCLGPADLPLWWFSSGSSNLMLAGLLLPWRLHLGVEAVALAASAAKLPRMCACLPAGALGPAYQRVAAAHARFGGSLLRGWLPTEARAAAAGGCLPLLAAAVVVKSLLATTLLSLCTEAAARAHFLLAAPDADRKRELRALFIALAAGAVTCASALPIAWEASVVGAAWAARGAAPSAVEAAAVGTSLVVQLGMRYWLHTVLTVLASLPLLPLAQSAVSRARLRAPQQAAS